MNCGDYVSDALDGRSVSELRWSPWRPFCVRSICVGREEPEVKAVTFPFIPVIPRIF